MSKPRPLIAIVDDDDSILESLPDLVREMGFDVQAFRSAEAFLSADGLPDFDCLILDIAMPTMSGWELHSVVRNRRMTIPVIFITAHDVDNVRERAMRAGAIALLGKPFSDVALSLAIDRAFGI